LNTLASLAASLVIGLAALEPDADAGALWIAAELEEEWQAELWGRDAEAEERRARRAAAFANAVRFAALARLGARND
ncbi:MAG: molecular chaperone, partial [Novosphingobium sp.]|nr:molecular chaperone [Novosphingobium sp.]